MRLIAALLMASSLGAQTVTWSLATITGNDPRGAVGWYRPVIDPVSGQIMINSTNQNQAGVLHTTNGSAVMTYVSGDAPAIGWGQVAGDQIVVCGATYNISPAAVVPGVSVTTTVAASSTGNCAYTAAVSSIYAGDFFFLNPTTSVMTWGNGVKVLQAGNWPDTASYPGPRHPSQQQAVDTKNGRIWFTGGADGSNTPQSPTHMNYLNLTTNPTNDTFGRVTTATAPFGSGNGSASMAYDPDDDIIMGHGATSYQHATWIFCNTAQNPVVGTVTTKQSGAACAAADDWNDLDGTVGTTGTGGVLCATDNGAGGCPVQGKYSGLVYSVKTHLFYMFGGMDLSSGNVNTTWSYNPRTRVWTKLALSGTVPPAATGMASQPSLIVIPDGTILYIYGGNSTATVYALSTATGTWSTWVSGGAAGPNNTLFSSGWTEAAYSPTTNQIVAVSLGQTGAGVGGNGIMVWYGVISGASSSSLVVPLTVQPALYVGGPTDVARTAEPYCMGVPIADSAAITSAATLTMTGAVDAAQMRILSSWPSGNAKWVKTCGIVTSVPANGTATVNLQSAGAGNWGGVDLATNNFTCAGGSDSNRICVDTGSATFEIKKANTNLLDIVKIGSTTIVATSTSATRGLVLTGPDPTAGTTVGKVTCSPDTGGSTCTTLYTSANDAASTCSIEENGPVMAVVKCIGTHYDGSSHPYMHFTARMYFYKNKTNVSATITLRNADYAASSSGTPSADCNASGGSCTGLTFNTAFKAVKSYEFRLGPNISAPITYNIATDTTPTTGTVSTAAYAYQGQSDYMSLIGSGEFGNAFNPNKLTADLGFTINNGGSAIVTGNRTKNVGGWADCSNSSGVGIQIGVYQFSGFWPISLECLASPEVRIGLYSAKNTYSSSWAAVYQAWPQWSMWDVTLNFHAAALSSPQGDFQKFEDRLLARPTSLSYINAAGVFGGYTLVDPTEEDAYYVNVANTASPTIPLGDLCYGGGTTNCTPDRFTPSIDGALGLFVWRTTTWGAGGGPTYQQENRWSNMLKLPQRGYTADFMEAWNHYRMQAWGSWPHADGGNVSGTDATVNSFNWQDKIHYGLSNNEIGASSRPQLNDASRVINYDYSYIDYPDFEHNHWWGITDMYMMTGDETIKESIVPEKSWYLNADTYQQACCGGKDQASRTWGIQLGSSAHFSEYLASLGDTDATSVLASGAPSWTAVINPLPCMADGAGNHYPSGCTLPNLTNSSSFTQGVSLERGVHLGWRTNGSCPASVVNPNNARYAQNFMMSIVIEGLGQWARVNGTGYADYKAINDKALGIGQWMLTEGYLDDGTTKWCDQSVASSCHFAGDHYNGFRYRVFSDFPNVCAGGTVPDGSSTCQVGSEVWDCNFTVVGNATVWWPFIQNYRLTGSTAWQRQLAQVMVRLNHFRSNWSPDLGGVEIGQLIYYLNHPGASSLQDVTISSFSNLGGGTQSITYTVPAGSTSPRLKIDPGTGSYAPRAVQTDLSRLLLFDPTNTNNFTTNATTNIPWFSATDYTSQLPSWTAGSHTTTITTGVTTLASNNFSLKAFNLNGCGLTPTTLGPWTNTQASGFGSLTAGGCPGSTYACSGLPTGLSINSSTGAITGTTSAAATFTPTCTYSTASQPYTIVVNSVPSVTTSGAMAAGTQGSSYSQTISTSGGTAPNTCALFGGSLTGSGLTVNSNCTVTGTAGTPATYTFTVKATDANSIVSAASSNITITVNAAVSCNISPTTLGPYTQNVSIGTVTLTANSCGVGALTWSSSGLPAGVSGCNAVMGTTCTLTGTPTTATTYAPTISVTDGGANSNSINPTVIVSSPPGITGSTIIGGKSRTTVRR